MNENVKWIFLYGGLSFGLSMALFLSILRWIEYKPPAFDSLFALILVCIFVGIAVGFFTRKLDDKQQNVKPRFFLFIKSIFLLLTFLCIYGLCFRYILIPAQLESTFISSFILLGLMAIAVFMQLKVISKK